MLLENFDGKCVQFYDKPNKYVYKYVQSHSIILQQHVSVTPVSVISVSCSKNTINIQITVQ